MSANSPFAPIPERGSFLETVGAADALRRLESGLGSREPFVVVIGESGSGKTALANEAISRWVSRVTPAFVAYAALSGAELLEEIVRRFGADPPDGASRPRLMLSFEAALKAIAERGHTALLVVDDAHLLTPKSLEELRLLVNAAQQLRLPLEVLLVGLPALAATLDDPALGALRQRVSVRVRLEPLSQGEVRRFVRHRAAGGKDAKELFPRRTCQQIAALSLGLPRRINALAAEALAIADGDAVTPEHVDLAAAQLWGALRARVLEDTDDEEDVIAVSAPSAPAIPVIAKQPEKAPTPAPAPAYIAPPREEDAPPAIIAPTSHDPREWVARFGKPIQIGSRAAQKTWAPLPSDPMPEGPTLSEPAAAPEVRRRKPKPQPAHARTSRKPSLAPVLAAVAALVAIGAVALVVRSGWLSRGHASHQAKSVAVAPSTNTPPSAAATDTRPVPAVVKPPKRVNEAPPEPATLGKGPYTVDVGGYLELDRALEERDRIQRLTGIQGWVVPAAEGSGERNHLVLGIYRAYRRANASARMLTHSRTLREATVVPLPPASERR